MSTERRRYPRSPVVLEAVQEIGGRRVPRRVASPGSGGFFVEDEGTTVRLGDLVVLVFDGPDGAFRVTGEVAYVTERGFGVRVTRADWRRLSALGWGR